MLTKDLIALLLEKMEQDEDDGVVSEILIDVFSPSEQGEGLYVYEGYSNIISIEKSDDGAYDILSCFAEVQHESIQ